MFFVKPVSNKLLANIEKEKNDLLDAKRLAGVKSKLDNKPPKKYQNSVNIKKEFYNGQKSLDIEKSNI